MPTKKEFDNLPLKAFLYMIVQDCIHIGTVEVLVEEAKESNFALFEIPELEKYVDKLIERLKRD